MNTQSPPETLLSQLRHMLEHMPAATLSSIDEHGALLSSPLSRWEMDDCGALWLFTDPRWLAEVYLPSLNLSFADPASTRRVSLSGHTEICPEDLSSEYLLGSIWPGHLNPSRMTAQTQPTHRALLKFTPQSAVYWNEPQSLMTRLYALITSAFGATTAPAQRGVQCLELTPAWELDTPKLAT